LALDWDLLEERMEKFIDEWCFDCANYDGEECKALDCEVQPDKREKDSQSAFSL